MPHCTIVPHRSIPLRPAVVIAAAALVCVVLLAAAGCRSTPTPTPTSPPITYPSPHPSATNEPSATPKPQPTRTAMPTVDAAVPLPVAMTLDEARAEVWSWLDPGHAPRIVSVDYIPGAMVAMDRDSLGQLTVIDFYDGRLATPTHSEMPLAVVRVVAECAPLDMPVLFQQHGVSADDDALPVSGDVARLVALFDAATGARLAAQTIDPTPGRLAETALAAPTAAITVVASRMLPTDTIQPPRWTPESTPTTMPTPIAPTVEAARVPTAMRAALADYPLLPGSTWTWEVTDWFGAVNWVRSRMTETVVGAWQIDPARTAVRSRVELRREFPPPSADDDGFGGIDEVWRTVVRDGSVYEYPIDLDVPGNSYLIRSLGTPVARLQLPIEAVVSAAPPFSWVPAQVVTSTRFALTTPAGRFADCGWFATYGGSTVETVRAICPGVGYVETDSLWGGWSGIDYVVVRLVRYHVELPR